MYNTCIYTLCVYYRSKSISKTLSIIYMYICYIISYIPTIRKCLQYNFPLLFRCIYLQSIKVTDMFMATTTWIWPFKALLNPVGSPERLQTKKILKLGFCVLAAFFETLCLLGIVSSPSYNKRWQEKNPKENKNEGFLVARNPGVASWQVIELSGLTTKLQV